MTTTELLEKEVLSKVVQPTDNEAHAYFLQNRDSIQVDFDRARASIVQGLRQSKQGEQAKTFVARLRSTADLEIQVDDLSSLENQLNSDLVLASLDGKSITLDLINKQMLSISYKVERQVYRQRKATIDSLIDDILLEREAMKRGISIDALIEIEVESRRKTVTKADAWKSYVLSQKEKELDSSQPAQLQGLIDRLQDTEDRKAKSALLDELRSAASIQVHLAEPSQPVVQINTENQPFKGEEDAPVTIVEFIDYECPACANLQELLQEILEDYPGQVRVVARDFPLRRHEKAYAAALAAEAAREQGLYWEYIALLYENQSALEIKDLQKYADTIGLDRARFDKALATEKFADNINQDRWDGLRLGLNSTPSVFVNGRKVSVKTFEALRRAVDTALATE